MYIKIRRPRKPFSEQNTLILYPIWNAGWPLLDLTTTIKPEVTTIPTFWLRLCGHKDSERLPQDHTASDDGAWLDLLRSELRTRSRPGGYPACQLAILSSERGVHFRKLLVFPLLDVYTLSSFSLLSHLWWLGYVNTVLVQRLKPASFISASRQL